MAVLTTNDSLFYLQKLELLEIVEIRKQLIIWEAGWLTGEQANPYLNSVWKAETSDAIRDTLNIFKAQLLAEKDI